MQFKFVGLMAVFIAILFGLLNTYPLITSRDLVFSEKESAMLAQQPATAAPPASPVSEKAAQMAAEEMGSVSTMPTTTLTSTPIRKGRSSVAHMKELGGEA